MGEILSTDRGSFFVDVCGPERAPAVVFVAGLGDDHSSWSSVLPQLSKSYRCVTFDNRGIGRSPITDGPYTTAEMALDARAVVRTLGLERVAAVGSSMGGAICQEWAIAHPEDLTRIVLTNTWAERDTYLTVLFDHWIDLAERSSGRDLLKSLLLFCYSPDFLTENPDVAPGFLGTAPPDLRGFAAAAAACRDHHAIDRVGRIDVPALVIAGRRDILTRPALSERLADAMPRATLETIDAAHMIFWERPDEFVQLVDAFLR